MKKEYEYEVVKKDGYTYDFQNGYSKNDFSHILNDTSNFFLRKIIIKNANIDYFQQGHKKIIHFVNCNFDKLNIKNIKKVTFENCKVNTQLYINDKNNLDDLKGLDYSHLNSGVNLELNPKIQFGSFLNWRSLVKIQNEIGLLFSLFSIVVYFLSLINIYQKGNDFIVNILKMDLFKEQPSFNQILFAPLFSIYQQLYFKEKLDFILPNYIYIVVIIAIMFLILIFKNIKTYGFNYIKIFENIDKNKTGKYLLYITSLLLFYLVTNNFVNFLGVSLILGIVNLCTGWQNKSELILYVNHIIYIFNKNISKLLILSWIIYCFVNINNITFINFLCGIMIYVSIKFFSMLKDDNIKRKTLKIDDVNLVEISCEEELYNLPYYIYSKIDLSKNTKEIINEDLFNIDKSIIIQNEKNIKEQLFLMDNLVFNKSKAILQEINIQEFTEGLKTKYGFLLSLLLGMFFIIFGGISIFIENKMIISDSTVYSYAVMKQYDSFCIDKNLPKKQINHEKCRVFSLGDEDNYYPAIYPEYNPYFYSLESLISPFELEQTKHFKPKDEKIVIWTYLFKFFGLILWLIIFNKIKDSLMKSKDNLEETEEK